MDGNGEGSGENPADEVPMWPLSTAYPEALNLSPEQIHAISTGVFKMDVLELLFAHGEWDAVDDYLTRMVSWNFFESKAAVENVPFGIIDQEHPELALLSRRKHVHRLIGQGKSEEATKYYMDKLSVLEDCDLQRVRKEVSDVRHLIDKGATIGLDDDDAELAIKDDIFLHFPAFRPPMSRKRKGGNVFSNLWEFAWRLEDGGFRCLACHSDFPNQSPCMIAHHLRGDTNRIRACPAVTESLLKRLLQLTCRKGTDGGGQQPPPDGGSGAKRMRRNTECELGSLGMA